MADPTRQLLRWLAAHDTPDRVVLLCADAVVPPVARGTVVVRLRGHVEDVGVGLPAQLLAAGVGVVAIAACRTRPHAATAQLASWRGILTDRVRPHDPPPRLRRARPVVLRLGEVPLPRRVVLGLGLRDGSPLDLDDDDAARTLAALHLLGVGSGPGDDAVQPPGPAGAPAGPWSAAAALTVDGCVACGVCVRACPHDALVLEHGEGSSTLTHLREECRSELECLRLCPVDAFSTSGALPLADVLSAPTATLAQVVTAACERCGARHPADEGPLCPTCRFRDGNTFGSTLPPGLAARLARERGDTA